MMRLLAWAAVAAFVFLSTATAVSAQEDPSKIKTLAPGVLKVIPTTLEVRDSYSTPMNLPGLNAAERKLNYTPQSATLNVLGPRTTFFRDVWQYEFAFTGLRQASVLMQYPDGTQKRKNIWYMVYRIRDLGKSLSYDKETDKFGHTNYKLIRDGAITDRSLAPPKLRLHFTLEGMVKPSLDADYQPVKYSDLGEAGTGALADYIQSIEDPNLKLHHKGELGDLQIPLAQTDSDPGIWGVAIWEDVDPQIDYVSVYVRGLTNAYRIHEKADGEIDFTYKTLKLNFWRAGDEVGEIRDRIQYGIPLVDEPDEQVKICRNYELPAPILRGYLVSQEANQNIPVVELDAKVNLADFTSLLTPQLDAGTLPDEAVDAFAKQGIDTGKPQVTTETPGERWSFTAGGQKYLIQYEPQFWKQSGEGIEFIKTLDHFWIYR